MGKRAVEHDKWLANMHATARAEEFSKKEEKGYVPKVEEKKCSNCELNRTCKKFRGATAFTGTYSIGGDSGCSVCEKWKARKKSNILDQGQIKSLMKQFKRNANS